MISQSNPFENPKYYRDLILTNKLLNFEKKNLTGKSLACIFLTRFCGVGCPFCFYKSAPAWRKKNIEDQFSDQGIENFIEFSKKANLGYLLVSGGGEPLNQKKHILKIVEEITADRIVLVTSGNWSQNIDSGVKYIKELYEAFKRRKSPTKLVVRVSVSEGHSIKLGIKPALNLIEIFNQYYKNEKDFILQIKTFQQDSAFKDLIDSLPNVSILDQSYKLISDNDILIKIIPEKVILTLDSGYQINVGISKIFNSDLRVDLNNNIKLEDTIKVFEEDLQYSENYNSAVVFNKSNLDGLDWSINYNGDICTWQNQVRDNYMNLYEDSYEQILEANFEDPITYSLIDKGNIYRDKIVSEVNPKAVLRMKAISLRDTSGTIIFEEEKTRLYYAIRVLQDYIKEGKIKEEYIENWPKDLIYLVKLTQNELVNLHNSSSYNIIKQQILKPFEEKNWYDFLELLKLGHYDVNNEQIQEALDYYNSFAERKVHKLSEIHRQFGEVERRLTERLMHMKPLKNYKIYNQELVT